MAKLKDKIKRFFCTHKHIVPTGQEVAIHATADAPYNVTEIRREFVCLNCGKTLWK